MNALRQLFTKLGQGASLSGDDLVALGLLLTMVASLSHLITMLATRWGDRHLAVKSLLASLLVHAVCLLGLEVFEPLNLTRAEVSRQEQPRPEIETQILVESSDSVPMPESGNTPVADQMIPPDADLSRLPFEGRLMEIPEAPDRRREVLDSLDPLAPDVSQFQPSDVPEVSIRMDAGREAPRVSAANDTPADLTTMAELSKADVYVPDTQRIRTQRGDLLPSEKPLERTTSPGSFQKIAPQVVAEDISLPIATSDIAGAIPLPAADTADRISQRTAPLTTPEPLDVAGLSPERSRPQNQLSRSFESRLQRPARTMRSETPGERPVRQNSLTASTPIPLTSDYDEVRTGQTSMNITDALRSAASLVEPETHSIRRRESRSATYKLRDVEQRQEAAARMGGTRESEAAVERSLRWFSRTQSKDGHWDAEEYGAGQIAVDENGVQRDYAGRHADSGITALVSLSFLGAGYTHEDGHYALTVDRALDWIIRQQDEDGCLAGAAGHYARMYCHAMATYALAEALGMQEEMVLGPIVNPDHLAMGSLLTQTITAALMTQQGIAPIAISPAVATTIRTHSDLTGYGLRKVDDIRLRSALLKAVTFTISQQDPGSGGWRYKFRQEGDVSMFGWQMMSLKSAAIAGVRINPTVRERMIRFLNSVRQGKEGGLFGYRRAVDVDGGKSEPVTPVMTAEALFCQQMLGYPRESPASREAVEYLLTNMPKLSELNMYYWYYGTLAMYQYGGQSWEEWNNVVRDTLVSQQVSSGPFAGSWDPVGPWGRYGGRMYSTALSTLTLEVYYRLLPLYRMNETSQR
ncbi:MAG: prenyltransferase/squalene oxidase repeat-containing protein [Planctomycetaceae bacterium]